VGVLREQLVYLLLPRDADDDLGAIVEVNPQPSTLNLWVRERECVCVRERESV